MERVLWVIYSITGFKWLYQYLTRDEAEWRKKCYQYRIERIQLQADIANSKRDW